MQLKKKGEMHEIKTHFHFAIFFSFIHFTLGRIQSDTILFWTLFALL